MLDTLIATLFLAPILSECFGNPKSFLILLALFGPSLLSFLTSVSPAISFSPLDKRTRFKEVISFPMTHPLTDFLKWTPSLLHLYPVLPGAKSNFFLFLVRTPYFMANPLLSDPPVILKIHPSSPCPNLSPSTSSPNL
jgi:hypothetical protein